MHFHSRSRGRLWRKGETSGNVLRVGGLGSLDCDGDAILWSVDTDRARLPHRRALLLRCEPGTDAGQRRPVATDAQGFAWLETPLGDHRERARLRPEGSYTTRLLDAGVDLPARKVAEEAVEVLMAAKDDAVAQAARDSDA